MMANFYLHFDNSTPRTRLKRGFTLIELLVYMAIVGIVVVVAGQVYSDSTKMRIRTQNMISANEIAENVGNLLKDDLEQMGSKSSLEEIATSSSDLFSTFADIYIDPANSDNTKQDSSSFVLTSESDIKFRKIRYDDDGHYAAIEEVRWFVDNGTLKRSCWTVATIETTLSSDNSCSAKTADEATAVEMAQNATLVIKAGNPTIDEDDAQMFPPSGDEFMLVPRFGETHFDYLTVENSGESTTLTGFASNFDRTNNKVKDAASNPDDVERNQLFAAEYESGDNFNMSSWKSYCARSTDNFTFEPGTTYELSFSLTPPSSGDKMSMFAPGRDFLAVGFRNSRGQRDAQLNDFMFYPPTTQTSGARERKMRFSVGTKVTGQCIAFTFVSYSPVTSDGTLIISNLKLKKVITANYDFSSWNPEGSGNIVKKKNVKAFQIALDIKKGQAKKEGGSFSLTVPTPANGPRD